MSKRIVTIEYQQEDETWSIAYDAYPVAQSGHIYDLTKDKIILKENRTPINFKLLPSEIYHHCLAFISYCLPRMAEQTVFNRIQLLFRSLKFNTDRDLEEQIKEIYKQIVQSKKIPPESKSMMRTFYGYACQEDLPYFDEDFYDFYLCEIQFGSNPNKGLDVLIPIENKGCLTAKENRVFHKKIKNVDCKTLPIMALQGFIGLRTAQLTAARDVQVRNLKVKHFNKKNGQYSLDIPRAKQRGKSKRKSLKRRLITNKLGMQIECLINEIKSHGVKDIKEHYLLFTLESSRSKKITNKNLTADLYRSRVKAICNYLGLEFIVTNRRLRKTLCTTLVAQGTSLKVIAEIMDHSDLQQLEIYYCQTQLIAKKINTVLLEEFSELIDIFKGIVIHKGQETQPGQLIFAETKDAKLYEIGSCGRGKPCALSPPLSCYSCPSVELFEDADHGAVLDVFTHNIKNVFGEAHAIKLLENDDYLALGAVVKKIAGGDYE